jgi:hypothetical protein
LLDDAARAKSLSPAKLSQLREELRQHREEADADRLVKLIDTRLQQDHLLARTERDSAAFYLQQARQAGRQRSRTAAAIAGIHQEIAAGGARRARSAPLGDAEREINEARNENVGAGPDRGLAARSSGRARSAGA